MHAALTPTQDGRAVLEDLGSSGGTMVNGSRISGPVFLVGGERIQIGANALELVVAAAPVATLVGRCYSVISCRHNLGLQDLRPQPMPTTQILRQVGDARDNRTAGRAATPALQALDRTLAPE